MCRLLESSARLGLGRRRTIRRLAPPEVNPATVEELTTNHGDAVGNLDDLITTANDSPNLSRAVTIDDGDDRRNRLDLLTHFVDADGDGSYNALTEQAVTQLGSMLYAAANRVQAEHDAGGEGGVEQSTTCCCDANGCG